MKTKNIICVGTQKGGVGKTTTVLNIGAGLRKVEKSVLLIDLDQQNHLSRWLGFVPDGNPTIAELIYGEVSAVQASNFDAYVRHCESEDVDYIPANKMLGGILSILGADSDSSSVLERIFAAPYFEKYDYIILDCPPAMDLLVTNAVKACSKMLIPIQADLLAYEGVNEMLTKLMAIKQTDKLDGCLLGMLVTMFDVRTNMSKEVLSAARESYGAFVFEAIIPMRAEAKNTTATRTSSVNAKNSDVGLAYMEVVRAIIRGEK